MLQLSLSMHLATETSGGINEPQGPLFHRWLPNGEEDAVRFKAADDRNSLRIWFKRRGYMDGSFVRYAHNRFDVDVETIARQGWVDAGALSGEAIYCNVTAAEIKALREDAYGSPEYIALGKRVIEFLLPPLRAFVDTLRLQFGQYWLGELRAWDSRDASLGGYCQSVFHLKWREHSDEPWRPFLPDPPSQTVHVQRIPGRGYGEYLTQQDWRFIQTSAASSEPLHPLALRIAGRAHELSDLGFEAEAYIQATTALELALEHYVSIRAQRFGDIGGAASSSYAKLPLTQQLALIALAVDGLSPETVASACRAVDARNRIVHEARPPKNLSVEDLLSLLRAVQFLLGLPEFKSPRLTNGNELCGPAASAQAGSDAEQ